MLTIVPIDLGSCRSNFNLDAMSGFAYGRGIYFSKYPTTSLLYGEALVVCKVLLGRRQPTDATLVADGKIALEPGPLHLLNLHAYLKTALPNSWP